MHFRLYLINNISVVYSVGVPNTESITLNTMCQTYIVILHTLSLIRAYLNITRLNASHTLLVTFRMMYRSFESHVASTVQEDVSLVESHVASNVQKDVSLL